MSADRFSQGVAFILAFYDTEFTSIGFANGMGITRKYAKERIAKMVEEGMVKQVGIKRNSKVYKVDLCYRLPR